MYNSENVKCADCKDVFRIEFDSRKKQQDVYTCKCGKLQCYPDSFGLFSYDRGGNYEKMEFVDKEYISRYYEEDYIKLTAEEEKLLSEINDIGLKLNQKKGSTYSNYTDNERLHLELTGCNSRNEGSSLVAEVQLRDDRGWKYGKERREKRLLESLTRFKEVILKVESGEINLSRPQELYNDETLEWDRGDRTQQTLYDYELYC